MKESGLLYKFLIFFSKLGEKIIPPVDVGNLRLKAEIEAKSKPDPNQEIYVDPYGRATLNMKNKKVQNTLCKEKTRQE